ncbi:MAG: adenosylmethionine--8-amino-7-oxononanoate transaminase [Deltaproteobacteria bacterium]|nr:adenosylmethionine--8-amino-7-oxononanoate transaminase [Deltaproteobacteria bacterium]
MAGRTREQRLIEDDRRYLWHPFTQMAEWAREEPLVVERAEGCHLIDIRGRRYLDGVSSLWVNLHGHRHPRLDRALRTQLDRVAHSTLLGLSHPPAIELARALVRLAPRGLTRCFFSDNGSTAVEVALKMAFQYWQHRRAPRRRRFVAFSDAYHGDTLGAVSVGGISLFHQVYSPLLFDVLRVPGPYCYRCPLKLSYPGCGMACLELVEETLRRHRQEVAGLILEPLVQGAGGMLVQPPGYLRAVRDLCTKYGILLIADEVAVGFGRTGKMFACEHEGVTPDLLCLAKGITGGYLPLAATLTTEAVYEAFLGPYPQLRTFFHGHSYTGNPLACAVALANLEIFRHERVLQRVQSRIAAWSAGLDGFRELAHVGEVRQRGLIAGIELVRDRESREPYPLEAQVGIRVARVAREGRVILRPLGNVIVLMPPLAISPRQLTTLLRVSREAIRRVTEEDAGWLPGDGPVSASPHEMRGRSPRTGSHSPLRPRTRRR